jgi:hypothetical protein
MQVQYKLKIGQDEFTLTADVKDEKSFFEEMSFYSNLPRTAPGGSTDLKLVFRSTSEGHKYYSIISEKEKMEYKFGQNKEKKGNGLYPKGWEPLYGADQVPGQQANPLAGLAPQPQAPAPQAPTIGMVPQHPVAPAQPVFNNPMPTPQAPVFQNPFPTPQAPLPNPSYPGLVNPVIGPTAAAAPVAPVSVGPAPTASPGLVFPQASAQPAAPAQLSPELAAAKSSVLDRFNIKKS